MCEDRLVEIGSQLLAFCERYDIPIEHVFEILDDQKVVPMLRGKTTEYNATSRLEHVLNPVHWRVVKMNPNPQPGSPDEDIAIFHRRTNIRLKVETKNAVRASMNTGHRCRLIREPHFRVKCHRSRSNMSLPSNDRYSVDSFDVLIANPANAIIRAGDFEAIDDAALLQILYAHYGVVTTDILLSTMLNDWRFVLPSAIAEEGFIPRTPGVRLANDPNWLPIEDLETHLEAIVQTRRHSLG